MGLCHHGISVLALYMFFSEYFAGMVCRWGKVGMNHTHTHTHTPTPPSNLTLTYPNYALPAFISIDY
jgi:hypothetical protein